jgi:TfoX/Sxy family transcriptional regulator of competence genes
MAYDEATAERMRHLLAERHDVHERKMFGGLAFLVKDSMCCTVSGRGGILVRVDPMAQPRLIEEPDVRPMVMGGRSVKTFVRVMPEGYRTHAGLKKWVQRGLDAAAALEGKSSARKSSPTARPKRQRKK